MFVLRGSSIHGVGVFTTERVPLGDVLRLWPDDDWREVSQAEADSDPQMLAMRDTYCVQIEGGYRCPKNFLRMSVGWFTNHSFEPNVKPDFAHDGDFVALRDIAPGEEIVCDYRDLSSVESAPV
jgi:SET domain